MSGQVALPRVASPSALEGETCLALRACRAARRRPPATTDGDAFSGMEGRLLDWLKAVGALYGVRVHNLSSSLRDGQVIHFILYNLYLVLLAPRRAGHTLYMRNALCGLSSIEYKL